jgi:hypothetical protein
MSEINKEIENVAYGQKFILYAILINIVAAIAKFAIGNIAIVFNIAAIALSLVGLFRLSSGLGYKTITKILLCICFFIPLVNIITLVVLSSKATGVLREAGYKVGLLGAKLKNA